MGDLILCVDDDDDHQGVSASSSSSSAFCRICHEGEFESCKRLEAPCACSGTIKFAHRDCIMRWCSEKGNAICEICLQKFEPEYAIALPLPLPNKEVEDTISSSPAVTIRVSVEIPSNQYLQSSMAAAAGEEEEQEETHQTECSSAVTRNAASCCRSLAIIFTILLLFRHVVALLCEGNGDDYPFTLLTMLLLRAAGILLPMYMLIRMITAIQNSLLHIHQSIPVPVGGYIDLHTQPA